MKKKKKERPRDYEYNVQSANHRGLKSTENQGDLPCILTWHVMVMYVLHQVLVISALQNPCHVFINMI